MAQILDGKAHADRMLEAVRIAVEARKAAGLRPPCLAVVLVGEDPASQVYVRNKVPGTAPAEYRVRRHTDRDDPPAQ